MRWSRSAAFVRICWPACLGSVPGAAPAGTARGLSLIVAALLAKLGATDATFSAGMPRGCS